MSRPALKLVWTDSALRDLEAAAAWSLPQARAVVEAMERMAATGWSLGRPLRGRERYWPVPPLGVIYEVRGAELVVVAVWDTRRRGALS